MIRHLESVEASNKTTLAALLIEFRLIQVHLGGIWEAILRKKNNEPTIDGNNDTDVEFL